MAEGKITRQNFSSLQQSQDKVQIDEIMNSVKEPEVVDIVKNFENSAEQYKTSVMGVKKDIALITETCKLPSKGLLYNGVLGSTLELRAMTTVEERMRMSGENFWSTMSAILNRCMTNTDFDSQNLTDFDFFAALVKLRIITYGNIYKTTTRCLSCEKVQDIDVDLDNLIITELPDDFKEPISIGPLPKSGDTLGLRFLRVFDHIDITNQVTAYNAKQNKALDTGNPEYTLEMEKMLVSVNGVELDSLARHVYVENMVGMDSSFFHKEVDKLFYGIHRVGSAKCKEENCSGLMLYQVAPDEQFFRTAFDD